ncbi:MAG: hypothetical protein O9284_09095 [Steroidobacteraceae bacterium]|nr:hypothetical protein [Steroidobacteraceae bacterium]
MKAADDFGQAGLVEWLSEPATWRDAPSTVARVETHFAWVFLTGSRAYKLKKRIRTRGVDLSTLAERERCCREELRLNRRLAAETYLDVLPVVRNRDGFSFHGPGVVVDWLVEMRQLDRRRMLDARLRDGDVVAADLLATLRHLQRLEPARTPAARGRSETAAAAVAGVRSRLAEALREFSRPEFEIAPEHRVPLADALRRSFVALEPVLAARASRVRDGHGDLRAEHVWLGEPLQVLDALEFASDLRRLDAVEDVAMLAVDCERIAGPWPRRILCAGYADVARDGPPPELWRFLLALRAVTRAKVALWHLDDPACAAEGDRWRRVALDFLALAAARLESDPSR